MSRELLIIAVVLLCLAGWLIGFLIAWSMVAVGARAEKYNEAYLWQMNHENITSGSPVSKE